MKTDCNIDLSKISVILFLVFMILKLCKVITWSWWFITMPLWVIPLLFFVVLIPAAFLIGKRVTYKGRRL